MPDQPTDARLALLQQRGVDNPAETLALLDAVQANAAAKEAETATPAQPPAGSPVEQEGKTLLDAMNAGISSPWRSAGPLVSEDKR